MPKTCFPSKEADFVGRITNITNTKQEKVMEQAILM